MNKDELLKSVQSVLKDAVVDVEMNDARTVVVRVLPVNIINTLHTLRDDKNLRFTVLTDLFGADFPEKKSRFEIGYNLLSLQFNIRIVVKTSVSEGQSLQSASQVFSAATWYEREVYDMFGVTFDDNPDPRRILTDYDFIGHPLRKDFPVTGHVQIRYDSELQKIIYEPVSLQQEFRDFDFLSPWGGPSDLLPGDEKANDPTKSRS